MTCKDEYIYKPSFDCMHFSGDCRNCVHCECYSYEKGLYGCKLHMHMVNKEKRCDNMKNLDDVLKAYEIHNSKDGVCRECLYGGYPEYNCLNEMEKDLYENLKELKEENEELKEVNDGLAKYIKVLEMEQYR